MSVTTPEEFAQRLGLKSADELRHEAQESRAKLLAKYREGVNIDESFFRASAPPVESVEQTSYDHFARELRIATPEKLVPLLKPARYKGAYGGRGGTKSHFFADLLIDYALMFPGMRAVCVREFQKSLEHSVKRLLEDKISRYGLGDLFRVMNTEIITPGGGVWTFQGMQNHTADSIKSLEGCRVAWVEEAQTLSQRSLDLLRPTIRMPGSELWFSWNPRFAEDPVDAFFRGENRADKSVPHVLPPNAVVVNVNWEDNPWFDETALMADMLWDRAHDPEKYAHVWGGKYQQVTGARIFTNWREEEFDTPSYVESFLLGGDWGYAKDPNTLIRLWQRDEHTLMLDWEAYKVGCEIEDTPALFDEVGCAACLAGPGCPGKFHFEQVKSNPDACEVCRRGRHCPKFFVGGHGMARLYELTADSARPETISYMRRHGYPKIRPSVKGAASVLEGIEFVKNFNIIVHPRCKHTIDELTFYSWKVDEHTEAILPVPADKKNHLIDSIRYAVEKTRRLKAGVAHDDSSRKAMAATSAAIADQLAAQRPVEARPRRQRLVF